MKRHSLGAAALVFLIISGLFLTAGCGQLNTPLTALFSDDGSAVDDASEGEDENSTIITDASEAEDGTQVGGYADGRMGDTLVNEFFSYCVNSAELINEYEGMTPADGYIFLRADLTVKNVFGEVIPMYSSDFQIQWGDEEEDYDYPVEKIADEQMEDEFEMARGETVNAAVVYEIPRLEGENEYSISYLEVYEDDMEGNVFFIYFDLETP